MFNLIEPSPEVVQLCILFLREYQGELIRRDFPKKDILYLGLIKSLLSSLANLYKGWGVEV